MTTNAVYGSSDTPIQINDEEHTLTLLMRNMALQDIIHVMALNSFLPPELPRKHDHIKNIVNLYFGKSYELHTIKTVIEFIANEQAYDQMFIRHNIDEMIEKYQTNQMAESDGTFELYLQPYRSQCVQCDGPLQLVFSHRPKTVISLTRTYKARE